MTTNTLIRLRNANQERQELWDPDNEITNLYRSTEFGGEAGEILNVVKKLERERLGIRGSRETVEHLGEEIADAIICLDLLAASYGIDLEDEITNKFNKTSKNVGIEVYM